MISLRYTSLAGAVLLALCACSSSSSTTPAAAAPAHVRYIDGAPSLEADVNGYPVALGSNAYLQAGTENVVSDFTYGSVSPFLDISPSVHSLTARNSEGYAVGPLKIPSLSSGKNYTLIVVGSYPTYQVLVFDEPAPTSDARLSLYEASPSVKSAGFGSFTASSHSNFKTLGNASFGNVVTVELGKQVNNFGGFAGPPNSPLGALTLAQVDPQDAHNILPFHNAARLSLFLFDQAGSGAGPVVGSLDR
ncbi:MAG TPA: DUF4397 domain-containing protein [Candidatus Cybelea sp.]|jgi:hypothetical protein|nr:DUF4397 domain-containing protein [Candidatus Cybelea sp.]